MPEPTRFTQLDLVMGQALTLIQADLDPYIASISGMPAIKSYGTGDPTYVADTLFPTVRATGLLSVKAQTAGRILEPQYLVDFLVVYKERGTDEAYYDGVRLADLIMQILLAHDVEEPYWRYLNRASCQIMPVASSEGQWQGGAFRCLFIGDQVTWA